MGSSFGRFDTGALYSALDAARTRRSLSWAGLARELRVASSTLTRTQAGGWLAGDNAAMFVDSLGLPHEAFTREPGAGEAPGFLTQASNVLHAQTEVPPARAEELFAALQARLVELGCIPSGSSAWSPRPAPAIDLRGIDARASPDFFTRIDSISLAKALGAARATRGLTWHQIAEVIGQPDVLSASSLAGIGAKPAPNDRARRDLGARTGAHQLMAVVQWLGVPSEVFMSRPPGRRPPSLQTQMLSLIRLRRDLPPGAARTIEAWIVDVLAPRATWP